MTTWFLHGFTGSGPDWDPLLRHLDLDDIWTPDLIPEDGPPPLPYASLDAAAEALACRAQEPVDVVGYSMGGRLALTFATRYPERIRRLVLIGASPGIASGAERAARRESDEALAIRAEADPLAFTDFWETVPILASQSRISTPDLAALRARRRLRSGEALAGCLRGWGTGSMRPLHDELDRVSAPALLFVGAEDTKYRRIADDLTARLSRCARFDVPNAAHTAHLERPEWVASHLAPFLATVDP